MALEWELKYSEKQAFFENLKRKGKETPLDSRPALFLDEQWLYSEYIQLQSMTSGIPSYRDVVDFIEMSDYTMDKRSMCQSLLYLARRHASILSSLNSGSQ